MKLLNEPERLSGLFLMLGGASLLFIIVEYIVVSSGAPGFDDLQGRAAYYLSVYPTLSRGWHFELVAMSLLGAGSLMRLGSVGKGGWALAAIGVAGVLPMYPLMIGGYPSALQAAQESTLAYEILNEIAWEVFVSANMVLSFGFALAFWLERKAEAQRAPGWILWIGFLTKLAAGIGLLGMHAGLPIQISQAGMFALIGFVALAIFGAFQAFKRAPVTA